MRIGFDAKRLFTNFTGLGNHSRNLVNNYHLAFPEDEIVLFTPRISVDERTKPFLNTTYSIYQPKGIAPLWRTFDVIKDIEASGVQIYHGLSHELPVGISKLDIGKVVTIHDLIFKYYPEDNKWIDRKVYDLKWKHACKAADIIIAVSEQTRQDLVKYYNVPSEKIEVHYPAADPVFSKMVTEAEKKGIRTKYHLPAEYILYVGSLISRKNLLSVIKAMILMKESERVPLVIIGKGDSYKKMVEGEAKRGKIDHLLIWLGSPSFEDFPAIYKNAYMMIYPSFHEGFGLPVVEAMQTGIPVITSAQSSLREAGGEAARLIDPGNPATLAVAMTQVLGDQDLRSEMIRKGLHHIEKFNPGRINSQLKAVYEKLSSHLDR